MFEAVKLLVGAAYAFQVANAAFGGVENKSTAARVLMGAVLGFAALAYVVFFKLIGGLSADMWWLASGVVIAVAMAAARSCKLFGLSWVFSSGVDSKIGWAVAIAILSIMAIGWMGKKSDVVAPVGAVPAVVVPAAPGCACYSGADLCTGPKGGKYCIDTSGNKRY